MATDGAGWYLSSNGSKRVVKFDDQWNRLFTVSPTSTIWDEMWNDPTRYDAKDDWGAGHDNPHLGALCFYQDTLYVPVQGPRGVWRINLKTAAQTWLHPSKLPDNDLFPWCDVHPATGMLYTANYRTPDVLHAYDRETLQYRPEHNVPLATPAIYLDKVQGGTFTDRGRLILVRYSYNAMFCYSSLNGHCFGSRQIGEDWSEVESVTVRPWNFQGGHASVHVFELDNDAGGDDCYLHCFEVPDPSRL